MVDNISQVMDPASSDSTALDEFVDSLPWPVITVDKAGYVRHVSQKIHGFLEPDANAQNATLAHRFPAFHAALRGEPWQGLTQTTDITRQAGEHTVHERLVLRPVSSGAYLIVIDQTTLHDLEITSAQTARLAALGFMIAGVCHEVSNPITSVQSMLQIMQAQKQLAPALLEKGLANIASSIKRLLQISSRLMNFSRVSEQEAAAFRLDTLIEEAIAILRQDPRAARIDIHFVAGDDAMIFGSMSCMQEVLVNVFENALQAMNGVGRLDIRITPLAMNRVAAEIRDTGPGISHHVMPRLFEPFFTTKPAGYGSGLGLSISNEILHEHRGTISAENNPDGGACFRIELPLWAAVA